MYEVAQKIDNTFKVIGYPSRWKNLSRVIWCMKTAEKAAIMF